MILKKKVRGLQVVRHIVKVLEFRQDGIEYGWAEISTEHNGKPKNRPIPNCP